jgi:protein YIPF6
MDDQKAAVFSGVFALVWLGGSVVTVQIKLLGGNV